MSPQVTMRESVTGTHLQVLLERSGTFTGLEGDAADDLPRAVLGGVKVGALVVALDPCSQVIRQPDIGPLGVRNAPEQIDVVHG